MVVPPAVVGILGHEEPAVLRRVPRAAVRPYGGLGVMLGSKRVQQLGAVTATHPANSLVGGTRRGQERQDAAACGLRLVHQVEDGHAEGDADLLAGSQGDKQAVEARGGSSVTSD